MEVREPSVNVQIAIAITLVVAGVLMRFIPHVPNFAPIGAIALFGGAMLGWRLAIWLPLAAMMISDIFLGFYQGIIFTWLGFLLVAGLGMLLKNKNFMKKVALGAPAAAVIFYLVSNFGVWLTSGMYSMTLVGFIDCYVQAIPFFRATLIGDLFFSTVIFGAYELATYVASHKLRFADSSRTS